MSFYDVQISVHRLGHKLIITASIADGMQMGEEWKHLKHISSVTSSLACCAAIFLNSTPFKHTADFSPRLCWLMLQSFIPTSSC